MKPLHVAEGLPKVSTETSNMHPAQREMMESTEENPTEETRNQNRAAWEKTIERSSGLLMSPKTSNADFFFDVMRQVQKDFVLVAATVLAWQYLTGGISVAFIAK